MSGKTDAELFELARAIAPDLQAAFLQRECSDADQINRVLVLLNAFRKSDSLLDFPPPGLTDIATSDLPASPMIQQVGPYRILRKLGEGGMGLVYLAEQLEPVKRHVALKVIKPGMDSAYVLARFEAERQALSIMDHPNIAKVFEAGTTHDGRPYFAMEWIQGISLTDYCDKNQMSPRNRMELFLHVCHAVHHAHQKGILHRDLKPSNILVTEFDQQPVPKVIDFGLAKALGHVAEMRTAFTSHGQIVGTIEYMSPEQAAADQASIDTRSDLYSLGVILYELLAGVPPFDKIRLREAGWKEMLRIVQEETPPRPSTRLSSIVTLGSVAAMRKSDPVRLSRDLKGELDWIVMKAIEKQSQRRYESVLHLAEDLNRFLNSEPIKARPPSTLYTISKMLNRHRASFVAGLLVTIALLAGLLGTSIGMIRANRSRVEAILAQKKGDEQRILAVQNAAQAAKFAEEAQESQRAEKAERERADENAISLAQSLEKSQTILYANQLLAAHTEARWGTPHLADQVLEQTDPERRGWEYRFLHSMLHRGNSKVLAGYGEVTDVTFSDDGSMFAAAGEDRIVRIWNTETRQLIAALEGHKNSLTCVRFVPGTRSIVSSDTNGVVHLWNYDQGGKPVVLLDNRTGSVGLSIRKDGKTALVFSSVAVVNEISISSTTAENTQHKYVPLLATCIAESPDQSRIAVVGTRELDSKEWFCVILNSETFEVIREDRLEDWEASNLQFSPDGTKLAIGTSSRFQFGKSQGVRLYSVETGELIQELTGNKNSIVAMAFSHDGKQLYGAGALDGSISIWDIESSQLIGKLIGTVGRIFSLKLAPDSRKLIAGGFGNISVWDLKERPFQQTLERSGGLIGQAVLNTSGTKVLASAGLPNVVPSDNNGGFSVKNEGQILSWNLTTNDSSLLEENISSVEKWIPSRSLKRSVTTQFDGVCRVWDHDSNLSFELTKVIVLSYPASVAFIGDDNLLVGGRKELQRWDLKSKSKVRSYPIEDIVGEVECDALGKWAVVDSNATFHILDLETGEIVYKRKFEKWSVRRYFFNNSGTQVIFLSHYQTMECIDVPSGKTIWQRTIPVSQSACFTSDDRRLLIGSSFDVQVLNSRDGSTILSVPVHDDLVRSVYLSPNDKQLLTIGMDNRINVFNVD